MSSPGFPTSEANHYELPFRSGWIFHRCAPVNNIAAVCGTSHLTTGVARQLVNFVLTLSITPKAQRFVAAKLSVWVARGLPYVDGDGEMLPRIMTTGTAVQ